MDSIETPEATKRCKQCGSHEILPGVYGLPTAETLARAALGEVLLGGCVVLGDEPDWRCAKCGAPFDIAEFAPGWVQELLVELKARSEENKSENTKTPNARGHSVKKTPPKAP